MFLFKVISGGQTGADQVGLKAAYEFGYEYGGFAPTDFLTSEGPNRQLLGKKYGLIEWGHGYHERTIQNVKSSDGTIRLAVDFTSPGEILTLKSIRKYNKPYIDVDLDDPIPVLRLYDWLLEHNIKVLNVAGNTEGKNGKSIFNLSYQYLFELFMLIKQKVKENQ